MTVTQITNAKYVRPDNSLIDMTVTDDKIGAFEFTYSPNDDSPTAKQIFELIAQGGLQIDPYQSPPALTPQTITKRQFLAILFRKGVITNVEALAAAQTGAVPAFLKTRFDLLAEPAKTDAYLEWATSPTLARRGSIITLIQQLKSLTDDQVDTFFQQAAAL